MPPVSSPLPRRRVCKMVAGSLLRVSRALARRWERTCLRLRLSLLNSAPAYALHPSVKLSRGVSLRATDGGRITIGAQVALRDHAELIAKFGRIEIAENTYLGPFCVLCAREEIRIGRDCLIAEMVVIRDQNHRIVPGQLTREAGYDVAPVSIGDNVWIGAKATILPGVTIGDNAVIGANSVVTREVPANTVWAGAPARQLRDIG